ncbi:MAG: hypothetical protein ACXACF_01535 [Candidatus Hermodarchaeia archaeon]|jgi:hypothetical protein
MSTLGIEHGAKGIVKQAAKAAMERRKRNKIKKDIAMKYQPKKTFKKADKKMKSHRIKEPQRKNFPKGKAGDIQYKAAMRKYLELIS